MSDEIKAEEIKTNEIEETPDPWSTKQRALLETLAKHDGCSISEKLSTYPTIEVDTNQNYKSLMSKLCSSKEYAFDFFYSHTCIDWLDTEDVENSEFELVTLLFSTMHLHYITVSTRVKRNHPVIATNSHLWPIAEFQEREVYDLFGIQYANHPDLRRLFLDDDWKGFPLRKDYQDDFMLEKPL